MREAQVKRRKSRCHHGVPKQDIVQGGQHIRDTVTTAIFAAMQSTLIPLDQGPSQAAYGLTYNLTNWTNIPFAEPPTAVNCLRAPRLLLQINAAYETDWSWGLCSQLALERSKKLASPQRPRQIVEHKTRPPASICPVLQRGFVQGGVLSIFTPTPGMAFPV